MRPLALALLFPLAAAAQPPDFPPPKTFPPDDATLTKIKEKTAELRQAMRGGRQHPDVLVYRVAAERIVQHHEWFTEKSAEQTLAVLEAGLERARNAAKKPWLEVRGKPVIFGYTSTVDSSVQVYAVRYPDDYDPKKAYRADVILHGRDATLTEVKFIHAKEAAKKGKPLDRFEIEIYGRGNNAYRWAGESDVFGVMGDFTNRQETAKAARAEWGVLRGFSMGGAGTWHLGLHHPFRFQALGPGAGFSTTREYIGEKKFGPQPDYVEKCLHIYDAVDYAENAFNVPVVAYSGEKDKQKLAADLIEAKLKAFKEPHSFTHLIAPGLEHKQPPEWVDKLELEYQKHLKFPRPAAADKFRFVTYTPAYAAGPGLWPAGAPPVHPFALQKQYEKAVVEGTFADGAAVVTTSNVRHLEVRAGTRGGLTALTVDGQKVEPQQFGFVLERVGGKWERYTGKESRRFKWQRQCGPIDDAFRSRFVVVTPTGQAWHDEPAAFADARQAEFARNWSKHLRGELVTRKATDPPLPFSEGVSQVLFGDPQSNPLIAEYLPSLPIKWTKDELVVNGKKYDPKTHLPVLVYPHPKSATAYVVLNSGHTFRDADFKGTNALLYPRLGDWAVLKAKPTKDDPAGFEVVDAGLFDENWQFKK